MINKVLVREKSELRAINRKYTEIKTRLSLKYNDRLEYCNLMLSKRVMSLDKINEECYQYISKLSQEVICLENEVYENDESLEQITVRGNDSTDEFAEIDIMSDSSAKRYRYNEYLETDDW